MFLQISSNTAACTIAGNIWRGIISNKAWYPLLFLKHVLFQVRLNIFQICCCQIRLLFLSSSDCIFASRGNLITFSLIELVKLPILNEILGNFSRGSTLAAQASNVDDKDGRSVIMCCNPCCQSHLLTNYLEGFSTKCCQHKMILAESDSSLAILLP